MTGATSASGPCTACAWVWLGMLALGTGAQAQERFALIIGANLGWASDRPLRYAEADAGRVRDVLVELGGFAADRVKLLQDPDTAQVRAALDSLNAAMRALEGQTLLFFYYSGHADEQQLHLRGPPLSHEELLELLRGQAGQLRIGVVDACRSGSTLASRGNGRRAPFEMQLVDELEVDGLAVFSPRGADELSQERRALAGSVFTHHLVSGLRGAADRDDDGQVTLPEAYEYAFQRTQADTAEVPALLPAEPQGQALQGDGAVVLSWLTHASSTLLLPREESARYVVVDRYAWRLLAEARSQPERQVQLVLPPGEYRLERVGAQQLDTADVRLKPGAAVEVSGLVFEPRPLSTGLLEGRPDRSQAVEVRAWRQSEALRLLAAGEARAALRLFDRILKEVPDDVAARRGRGRTLVLLAEAYARARNTRRERQALRAALVSDPALAEDPAFQRQQRRMTEAEAAGYHDIHVAALTAADNRELNPRSGRSFAVALEMLTPRAPLGGVTGSLILRESLFPYLTLDLTGALDAGLRWTPFKAAWSPLLGGGVHVSLKSLGVGVRLVTPPAEEADWEAVFGRNVHLDAGFQYVSESGLAVELGMALVLFIHAGKLELFGLPVLGVQVLF